jgi:hypothetical protein
VSAQNTQVSETKEFRCSYCKLGESKNEFKSVTPSVMCYRGAVVVPKWEDVDSCQYLFGFKTTKDYLIASIDNYTELCTIEVDLSHLPLSPQPKYSGQGVVYYVNFDIVLLFGLTEFKAAVAWKENVGLLIVHWINFYYQACPGC